MPTTSPPVCFQKKNLEVGQCVCFTVFKNILRVKKAKEIKRACVAYLGKKRFIKGGAFCKKFEKNGKIVAKKLVATANKLIKVCFPGQPKLILLK